MCPYTWFTVINLVYTALVNTSSLSVPTFLERMFRNFEDVASVCKHRNIILVHWALWNTFGAYDIPVVGIYILYVAIPVVVQ